MKQRPATIRFFGLFMLVSVLLNSITAAHAVVLKQPVSQETAEKANKKDAPASDEASSFSEWTSDVVVPSHAFSFDSNVIVVPTPQYVFIFPETVAFAVVNPLYRHSYFDKIYERHIAINAP